MDKRENPFPLIGKDFDFIKYSLRKLNWVIQIDSIIFLQGIQSKNIEFNDQKI